jgi:hypothetical protein
MNFMKSTFSRVRESMDNIYWKGGEGKNAIGLSQDFLRSDFL